MRKRAITAVSRNCEIYSKFKFSFRNNFYLSRKYAVPQFATDEKRRNVVIQFREQKQKVRKMELRLEADLKLDNSGNTLPCGILILVNNKAVKLIEHSNTNLIKQEFSKEAFPIKPNTYEVEYLHKYNLISEVHNATIQIKDGFKFYVNLNRNEKFKIKWMALVYWSKQPENTWKVLIFITATILAIIGLI